MKVFISWSGATSRSIAEALHWWFPKVIQGVRPFVSAKDIDKGSNWTVQLTQELDATEFGVVCLTNENLTSPWLHYEAGAIAKSVESRVCPVLDGIDKSEVKPPLAQLQLTELKDEDVLLMMASMNVAAGSPLSSEDLQDAVEIWWPRLDTRLATIAKPAQSHSLVENLEPIKPTATANDMLEELLELVRKVDKAISEQTPMSQSATRFSLTNAQRKKFLSGLAATWPEVTVVSSGSSRHVDPSGLPSFNVTLKEEPGPEVREEIRNFGKSLGLVPTYNVVEISTESEA